MWRTPALMEPGAALDAARAPAQDVQPQQVHPLHLQPRHPRGKLPRRSRRRVLASSPGAPQPAHVRAASVSALAQYAIALPAMQPSIVVLLKRSASAWRRRRSLTHCRLTLCWCWTQRTR